MEVPADLDLLKSALWKVKRIRICEDPHSERTPGCRWDLHGSALWKIWIQMDSNGDPESRLYSKIVLI